ncbi:MAG: Ohr family peroxiredoxin [Thermomicrobiales bacterium]|nr:Ohr family peroxiredoxin [Thermomicrobiales bacterium]
MGKVDVKYRTSVIVSGGRMGRAISDDGVLDVQLRTPKLNGVAEGTNPEQLFGAAWGACLQSALGGAARRAGVDASGSTITVEIGQGQDADGGYGLAARIEIAIPGVEREIAQRLVDEANANCPYSKAVKGNIESQVALV